MDIVITHWVILWNGDLYPAALSMSGHMLLAYGVWNGAQFRVKELGKVGSGHFYQFIEGNELEHLASLSIVFNP